MQLNQPSHLLPLCLAALVTACAGDPEPPTPWATTCTTEACDTGDEDTPSDLADPDNEPPQVIEVVPPDGATGVGPAAMIMIKFSEPMDPSSTEAAYRSADLPPEAVNMIWNAAGDTLTIRPKRELELGEGEDPGLVEARRYAFELATSARDLAGNELAAPWIGSFETLRRIRVALAPVPDWTGSLTAADPGTYRGKCTTGDNRDDAEVKFLVGFDLGALPEVIAAVELADLVADQTYVSSDVAYDELGVVVAEQVAFEVFDEGFDRPGSVLGPLSRSSEPGRRQLALDQALAHAHAWPDRKLQVRLGFETSTNGDGKADLAHFDCDSVALEVAYLLP